MAQNRLITPYLAKKLARPQSALQAASSGASVFPIAEWLAETSSGNHASVATSTNIYDSIGNQTSDVGLIKLSGDKFLAIYQNSSQHPTAQILDAVAESAGTAVTILASAVGVMFYKKVPGVDAVICGINNDLYYLACSGTTVTSTQISTDAGDTGKAEAFGLCRTDIDIADDATCFCIANTFNDAGTYRYVFAVWTLNISTPSCTYVTRSAATATGDAANFIFGQAKKTDTAKQFLYFGGVNGDTDLRLALVDYTASSVTITDTDSSTITGGFNGGSGLDHKGLSHTMDGEKSMLGIFKGGTNYFFIPIKIVSNNIVISTNTNRASFLNAGGHRHMQFDPLFTAQVGNPLETTAIRIQFGVAGLDTGRAVYSDTVLTGLTTVGVYASAISDNQRIMVAIGKQSTNTGYFFILKLDA